MIVQGSNEPLYIEFIDVNDLPADDISISLRNEIEELKHWGKEDVTKDELTYTAPISQEESIDWPVGPCVIEIKYLDNFGNIIHLREKTKIIPWGDKTILGD